MMDLKNMTIEERNRAVAMWGIAACVFAAAMGWMLMRFGISWSVADLPESDNMVRIIPAYIISEIAMMPIGAKLVDLYGVRKVLIFGPLIFILGSILSIVSLNVEMLIAFRFIEGIGGGLVLGLAFTAVGKYYEADKRNQCHELMTASFAFGSLFAAAIGYFFTSTFNWRAGFIMLALVMMLGLIMAWKLLPEQEGTRKPLDWTNTALVTLLFGVAAYYTQSVNVDYKLLSVESAIVVVVIVALLALVFWHSKRSDDPLIPMGITLFEKKVIILMFLFSMCGLGLIQYYFKVYLTYYEFDIYMASLNFLIMILGAAVPSLIGCKLVMKTGIRPWVTVGAIVVTISLVMTHFLASESTFFFALCLFVFGAGLGMIVTELIISLQSITPKKDMGQHTGNLMAVRMIGILVGNAVVGAYIKEVVQGGYVSEIIDLSASKSILADIGVHIANDLQYMSSSLNDGFTVTVLIMAVVTAILAVVAYTLKRFDLENRCDE